jgi:hypothetical protein
MPLFGSGVGKKVAKKLIHGELARSVERDRGQRSRPLRRTGPRQRTRERVHLLPHPCTKYSFGECGERRVGQRTDTGARQHRKGGK